MYNKSAPPLRLHFSSHTIRSSIISLIINPCCSFSCHHYVALPCVVFFYVLMRMLYDPMKKYLSYETAYTGLQNLRRELRVPR